MAIQSNKSRRVQRHRRVRRKIAGNAVRPRMAVCTSGKHIYIQFIDDDSGRTLAAASTQSGDFRGSGLKPTLEGAKELGKAAAEKAKTVGIATVVFDRSGFNYHGRIKAVADAAREAGLQF